MYKNPYSILGINIDASKDEIKKAYKEIALMCHPDKLLNVQNEEEKNRKIDRFKEATIAYELLIKDNYNITDEDEINWKDIWSTLFKEDDDFKSTQDILKDVFVDMANIFIQNNIRPKSYYTPKVSNAERIVHKINVQVTYAEVANNVKKKLRLILKDINDPIFVDIYCAGFPEIIKEYIDEEENEHDIVITMVFKKLDNYDHIVSNAGNIDLITSVDITLEEYLLGCEKDILYIDNNNLNINIPAFQKEYYEIPSKGLKGGSLILNICVKNIEKEKWDNLSNLDKVEMIRILQSIYKMI
jgi:DnaJ-class molecular chaperone